MAKSKSPFEREDVLEEAETLLDEASAERDARDREDRRRNCPRNVVRGFAFSVGRLAKAHEAIETLSMTVLGWDERKVLVEKLNGMLDEARKGLDGVKFF